MRPEPHGQSSLRPGPGMRASCRSGARGALHSDRSERARARQSFGLVVGERCAEESVGPFLGERSRLGEVDRHGRVADGERGEHLGDEPGLGVLELE